MRTPSQALLPVAAAIACLITLAGGGGPAQETAAGAFVLSGCESAADFQCPDRAAYQAYTFEPQVAARHEGSAIRWRFATKQQSYAELRSTFALQRPFVAISVWAKNPADQDVALAVRLVETDGSEYAAAPQSLAGQTAWRQLRFALDEFALVPDSQDEDGRLDVPLRELGIVARSVRPGQAYELYLDQVEAYEPPPATVRIESFSAPDRVRPGEALRVSVAVSAPETPKALPGLMVTLNTGETAVASAPLAFATPPSEWQPDEAMASDPVELTVPGWLAGGIYELRLGGAPLVVRNAPFAGGALARIRVDGPEAGPLQTEVREHGGVPTLFINGSPYSGLCYSAQAPDAATIRRLAQAGVQLISFPATSDYHLYDLAPDVWLGSGVYDYSALDERLRLILDAHPGAYLLPEVYICSPPWWDEQHLNECVLFGTGTHAADIGGGARKTTFPSWVSPTWRRDAGEALRRFVEHVEQSPYAHRVVGYQLCSGEQGRWRMWGSGAKLLADYSPAEKEAFRAFLERKYGSQKAFFDAWGPRPDKPEWPMGPEAGRPFDTAAVPAPAQRVGTLPPDPKERAATLALAFLDVMLDRPLIDYQLFQADRTAETIEYFANVAKEACGGAKVVGAAYGAVLGDPANAAKLHAAGQLGLGRLLDSPSVDFLTGPSFFTRSSQCVLPAPIGSVGAHGKLWFVESPLVGAGPTGALRQKQAAAAALSRGLGLKWVDDGRGPGDPQTMRLLGDLRQVQDAYLGQDRRSAAQVCVVLDENSLAYTRPGNVLTPALLADQVQQLGAIGAPYDVWLLSDLLGPRPPQYKLYIFLSAYLLDEPQRRALVENLAFGQKTAVWVYAPGYFDPEGCTPRNMHDLTGIVITGEAFTGGDRHFVGASGPTVQVRISHADDPFTRGVAGQTYGIAQKCGPVFYPVDRNAQELGALAYRGQIGLCVKRAPGGFTSVYSSAPGLPAGLLRNIAAGAGVHLYQDRHATIYAGRSFVGMAAVEPGAYLLRLPVAAQATDLLGRTTLAEGPTTELQVTPAAGDMLLLFLGDPASFW